MKIRITLDNGAGELDGMNIDIHPDDDMAEVHHIIVSSLDTWVLAPGDTIRIREVE